MPELKEKSKKKASSINLSGEEYKERQSLQARFGELSIVEKNRLRELDQKIGFSSFPEDQQKKEDEPAEEDIIEEKPPFGETTAEAGIPEDEKGLNPLEDGKKKKK